MVTSHSFANSFSNGVLLCNLVAGLELRAGGRGLHQISKTAAGNLSLEGVQMHPRTTGACTGNINIALKVLLPRLYQLLIRILLPVALHISCLLLLQAWKIARGEMR